MFFDSIIIAFIGLLFFALCLWAIAHSVQFFLFLKNLIGPHLPSLSSDLYIAQCEKMVLLMVPLMLLHTATYYVNHEMIEDIDARAFPTYVDATISQVDYTRSKYSSGTSITCTFTYQGTAYEETLHYSYRSDALTDGSPLPVWVYQKEGDSKGYISSSLPLIYRHFLGGWRRTLLFLAAALLLCLILGIVSTEKASYVKGLKSHSDYQRFVRMNFFTNFLWTGCYLLQFIYHFKYFYNASLLTTLALDAGMLLLGVTLSMFTKRLMPRERSLFFM